MTLLLRSDSAAGVAPAVLAALAAANAPTAGLFGTDEVTQRLARRLSEVFEREVWVFPVTSGTAANAIGLSAVASPATAICCHAHAHVFDSEVGAVEFYAGCVRLTPIAARDGKLVPEVLEEALKSPSNPRGVGFPVAAVTVTQLTEFGTAYTVDEVTRLGALAHAHGATVHMDGARLANALAHLGCAPADVTWRAGVDVLSLGGTKNGALAADAVVVFDPKWVRSVAERVRRGGHRVAKMRFLSAQLDALCAGELWLDNARHANAMARRLALGLRHMPDVEVISPLDGNLVFVRFPAAVVARLRARGVEVWLWREESGRDPVYRLVTAFNTTPDEIDAFLMMAGAQHNALPAQQGG